MSEIKPGAIRVREKREQQARLAGKLSLIKNKTRRDCRLTGWCGGQAGSEDPGHAAKQFTGQLEQRSSRQLPFPRLNSSKNKKAEGVLYF